VAGQLGLPLTPVLPFCLCPVPGPLYTVLMGYKESAVDEARHRFARRVGLLFAAFFATHRPCLHEAMTGGVDLIIPVPSSARPGPPSLTRVEGLVELTVAAFGGSARWDPRVLCRGDGPIGHMRPHRRAFAAPSRGAVHGARVLLLDDTYVSGARAQSAAATLWRAGARSVLIAPLGRVIRPATIPSHAAFLVGRATENGHRHRCLVDPEDPVDRVDRVDPEDLVDLEDQTGAGRR
jgi:hypothetical protein